MEWKEEIPMGFVVVVERNGKFNFILPLPHYTLFVPLSFVAAFIFPSSSCSCNAGTVASPRGV